MASLAPSPEGALQAEVPGRCRRNHTVELLPTIDRLLAQAGTAKADLTAVFVCTGPGMYTGLRVGVSTAQGLAYALKLPVAGGGGRGRGRPAEGRWGGRRRRRCGGPASWRSSAGGVWPPARAGGRKRCAWSTCGRRRSARSRGRRSARTERRRCYKEGGVG